MNAAGASPPTLRCLSCGYDVASLVQVRGRDEPGLCPECGSTLKDLFTERVEWLPRCLRCGYDLRPFHHDAQSAPSTCPQCSAPTDETLKQREVLAFYDAVSSLVWITSVCIAVRSPKRFLLSVDLTRTGVNLFAALIGMGAVVALLGAPATVLYEHTTDRARYHPHVYIDELRAPLEAAIATVVLSMVGAAYVGGWFTVLVVRRVEEPTQSRVLAGALYFSSSVCVVYAVLLAPFVAWIGFYPPPWTDYPRWLGVVRAIAEAGLISLGSLCTIYGVWTLRYVNPGRRPAASAQAVR